MTPNAPLVKLSYSALVTSLITAAVLIIFLATPRLDWYWWLGFVLFCLPFAVWIWGEASYWWTTRPGHRYPAAPLDYRAELAVRDKTRRGPELRRAA